MLQFRAVEWINLGNHRARKDHAQTESLWQKVAKTAAAESQYQPPPQAVRAVKTAFAMSGLAARRPETVGLIQLLYDSFLQPALAGTRSGSMRIRQMLYRADPYQIDFQIEAQPEQNRFVITGQLVDLSHPEMVGRDVEVTITDGRESVVKTDRKSTPDHLVCRLLLEKKKEQHEFLAPRIQLRPR